MHYFFSRLLTFFVLCFCISLSLNATPTQRYLEINPLDEILDMLAEDLIGDEISLLGEKLPSLLEIASFETEDTFFGYHGTTQKVRLFQDILRAVFEEALDISLPENFYFLRIPGQEHLSWENSKNSFLERFENEELSKHHINLIIKNFLAFVQKEVGISLQIEDFSVEELETIWKYFRSFIDYNVKCNEIKGARFYNIPSEYSLRLPKYDLDLTNFIQIISEKIIEKHPEVPTSGFSEWMKKFSHPRYFELVFYLTALDSEYDEEKKACYGFFSRFNDNVAPQQEMLVSLNISLLGNYVGSGEFTPMVLLENRSISFGERKTTDDLKAFFEMIGLDPSLVDSMENEGAVILTEAGQFKGCLLQFYDESAGLGNEVMSFVDQNTYVSLANGVPLPELKPSKLIQGQYKLKKNSWDLQLRLVMDNKTTLNPFSPLRMIRHEVLSSEDSEKILTKMKELLRNSQKDEVKLQHYKNALEELWND